LPGHKDIHTSPLQGKKMIAWLGLESIDES
jgi:hypothetical protein